MPSTGYLIWHLSLRWRAATDRALAPLGLTSSQYAVLATLAHMTGGGDRPSQRELADASGLETMHVSKLVRGLERAGLVARTANPADPRAVLLAVTDSGVATVEAAREAVTHLEEANLAPVGGSHDPRGVELRETLIRLLQHTDAPSGGHTP